MRPPAQRSRGGVFAESLGVDKAALGLHATLEPEPWLGQRSAVLAERVVEVERTTLTEVPSARSFKNMLSENALAIDGPDGGGVGTEENDDNVRIDMPLAET